MKYSDATERKVREYAEEAYRKHDFLFNYSEEFLLGLLYGFDRTKKDKIEFYCSRIEYICALSTLLRKIDIKHNFKMIGIRIMCITETLEEYADFINSFGLIKETENRGIKAALDFVLGNKKLDFVAGLFESAGIYLSERISVPEDQRITLYLKDRDIIEYVESFLRTLSIESEIQEKKQEDFYELRIKDPNDLSNLLTNINPYGREIPYIGCSSNE